MECVLVPGIGAHDHKIKNLHLQIVVQVIGSKDKDVVTTTRKHLDFLNQHCSQNPSTLGEI